MKSTLVKIVKSHIQSVLIRRGFVLLRVKDPFRDKKNILEDETVTTIIDLGAHIGTVTQKYKIDYPNARIYAFEPFPESIKYLTERFACEPRIKPIAKAVGDKPGVRKFFINPRTTHNSLLELTEVGEHHYHSHSIAIQVPITTIDEFCRNNAIEKIAILKMDIQGAELMALQGAVNTLETGAISLIYSEVWILNHYNKGCVFSELYNFLASYDYTLYDIYNLHRDTNGQLIQSDAIFISPSIRQKLQERNPTWYQW
jgi:FkbM family methyltransferase